LYIFIFIFVLFFLLFAQMTPPPRALQAVCFSLALQAVCH